MKKYVLKKEISHPFGTVKAGTESKVEGQFYVFPYENKKRDKVNGWLGNGYIVNKYSIDDLTEWFYEKGKKWTKAEWQRHCDESNAAIKRFNDFKESFERRIKIEEQNEWMYNIKN